MNFKKFMGCFMLMVTGLFVSAGSASILTIGTEEMPESMKKLR